MMNTEDKEVLIVFNDRRRPVKFTCFEDPAESYKSLVRAVENAFCDVLTAEEGSSNSEGGSGFYLQVESKKWGGMIDVTLETQIDDGSTIFLCRQKSRFKASFDSSAASGEKVNLNYNVC